MQFPDILKKYRANKGLTQKQLAEQLGVPLITVARMEQGRRVRLDLMTIELLKNMMEDESLDKLAGIVDIREWFRCTEGFHEFPTLSVRVEECLRRKYLNNDVLRKILSDFANIGFERIAGKYEGNYQLNSPTNIIELAYEKNDPYQFDFVLENKKTGKIWTVDFYWKFTPPYSPVMYGNCFERIYEGVGRSCCNSQHIQKYSLITNLSAMIEYMESTPIVPQNLPFDVSVIYYDLFKNQMSTEKNLTFFKNGQGIFDIDVEGKREAATLDYAKWTLMFDKRL